MADIFHNSGDFDTIDERLDAINKKIEELHRQKYIIECSDPDLGRLAPDNRDSEETWKRYVEMMRKVWFFEEMSPYKDRESFASLSDDMKELLRRILGYFLIADSGVNNVIAARYLTCPPTNARGLFLRAQAANEDVHFLTYKEFEAEFFGSLEEVLPGINASLATRKKIAFLEKYAMSEEPIYIIEAVSACTEGIFFCCLFAVIFWFRAQGKLHEFVRANQSISSDETTHRDAFLGFVNEDIERLCKTKEEKDSAYARVREIVLEAVEVEKTFIRELLPQDICELTYGALEEYVKVTANDLMYEFNKTRIFPGAKNPFPWVDEISMDRKANFFERTPGGYEKLNADVDISSSNIDPYSQLFEIDM